VSGDILVLYSRVIDELLFKWQATDETK